MTKDLVFFQILLSSEHAQILQEFTSSDKIVAILFDNQKLIWLLLKWTKRTSSDTILLSGQD